MHSLPSRLHSLVYLREFRAPDEEGRPGYVRKSEEDKRILEEGKGETSEDLRRPAVRRLLSATFQTPLPRPCTVYIVSSVYETHFKPLRSRLRFLRLYVYDRYGCPSRPSSATTPRSPPPPRHREINGLHLGLRAKFSSPLPPSFRANSPALSLNPRYPRADHLGNLSSCVDDADPERAWEPNDLSREVEYADTPRGGNRSPPACLREQRPVSRGVAQPAGSINHECLKDAL